jgi:hypothetical protein
MDTVTHALAPVILTRIFAGPLWPRWRGFTAIALAGALPDLINPHLSLQARMSSWSHGLPFWVLFSVILFGTAHLSDKRIPVPLAALCSAAYLFHLFCDAISGGVNWLYPFKDFIWGDYWVDPVFWIPLDVLCLLSCYFLFRVLPRLPKRAES